MAALENRIVLAQVAKMRNIEYEELTRVFWTDSQVVLGYINTEARRFHIYVANRVHQIRNQTEPAQWRYKNTGDNHADDASRRISPEELISQSKWLSGPDFLWNSEVPVSQP